MKKKILILALMLASLVAIFSVVALATDTPEEPALKIEAANLSFEDSVYVLYAVSHEGIAAEDIQMLFWTAPQDEYTAGSEAYAKDMLHSGIAVNDKSCAVFKNNELRAKNMADNIYARAYANVDGKEYCSEVAKYSILQYAYNKLGKTGTMSESETLRDMLVKMLPYGAAAQKHFNHNTARPADGEFYQVKVEGGVLEDGFSKGLYLATESATLSAPETKDGMTFSAWKNSAGEVVSTDAVATLTGFSQNETYTATYEEPAITYSEGLEFTLSDDGTYYIVSGIGTCTDSVLVIPPVHEGLPVKEIGERAFICCDNLTSVTIPKSITKIGDGAFAFCFRLVEVINHSSLNITTNSAAYGEIAAYAIEVHAGESKIVNINDYLFYTYNGVNYLVAYIGNDTALILPDSCNGQSYTINQLAFYDCDNLTSVTLPNSVTSIGFLAFCGCSDLTSINIPDSVTVIGSKALSSCDSLTSITIPDSVMSIGEGAFSGCSSLESITLPFVGGSKKTSSDTYQYPFGYIFGTSSYTDSVETSQSYYGSSTSSTTSETYYIPSSLKSVTITGGNILYGAFAHCFSLTSITLPDGITTIGGNAFFECLGLSSFTIPDSVTTIGRDAFSCCFSLKSITIPNSITTICDYAFFWCSALKSIYYKGTADQWSEISIGSDNTELTNATRYYYSETEPTTEGNFWHYVDGEIVVWPEYVAPSYSEGLKYTLSYDGTYYIVSGIGTCTDTDIVIPPVHEGLPVKEIGESAFRSTNLTSVTIPDSVTSIGSAAFYGRNSLTSVVIGDSVTEIGEYAFYCCTSLRSIYIGNSVTSIGSDAFSGCSGLTSVTIPASVTSIGGYAFEDCTNLTSVTIPDSVTSMGKWAFAYCYKLTIYCEATSKPSGWNSHWNYWNYSSRPVVWGYTGQEYTYTFVTNGGEAIESVTTDRAFTLPTPTRDGWYFGGWYDNAELAGSPVSSSYSSKTMHTLYAKWLTEEEYLASLDGSSFEKAYIITSGESLPAVIDTAGEYVYFKFTATESKTYTFGSSGSYDTYGYLYDETQSQIAFNDNGDDGSNFLISRSMSAGETVYIKVKMYSSSATGTFTVSVS